MTNTSDVQSVLRTLGWPIKMDGSYGTDTFNAVSDFQRGWGFEELAVDGWVGPNTERALRKSLELGGKCSDFFTFREFKSKGNGWIKVLRPLVVHLDSYRRKVGKPVGVVSGYRDPTYNARPEVGGAPNSQHLYGSGVDIPGVLTRDQVKALQLFSGIGVQRATGLVVHVDVRGMGGAPNSTYGSRANPTIWYYG